MAEGSIFVVLGSATGALACLHVASAAARILGRPPITVLHVRAAPASTILPSEEVLGARQIEALARQESAADADLAELIARGGELGATWRSLAGYEVEEIRRAAPGVRLAILPHPRDELPGHREALDTVLFEAGLPVVMVPASSALSSTSLFCGHLALGWRDSGITRRAVATFAPFIQAAERVTVVEVSEGDEAFPQSALAALAPLRPDARFETVSPEDGRIGSALLAAAARCGADTLLIGAHRHGVLADMMFGTVTRTVLENATIPVLLSA
ncbi:MAG TPA: universal stress protein [Acetobacteraceae bacterium]|nr:universal stress protein [Acetobacteraceae bacterium]